MNTSLIGMDMWEDKMKEYWHKILDEVNDHKVITGLVIIALVLFLAYSLLG
jgi:hypothetical protein